jgi:hypothetical protein
MDKSYRGILEDIGVDKNDIDDCMTWAFGEDWRELKPELGFQRWNMRHGLLLPLKAGDLVSHDLRKIGLLYLYHVKQEFLNLSSLYDLNQSEKRFRKALIKSFNKEGISDLNEMMDCLGWGLNYDQDLLRCHTYFAWPDAFRKNTGIEVAVNDSIEKCIRLLALKWKSKKKVVVPRAIGSN